MTVDPVHLQAILTQPGVADALRECAEHGRKFGVFIGLQNHWDFLKTSDQVLALLTRPEHITEVIKAILVGLPVADLRVEDPPLEEIMRQVFGG